MRAKVNRFRPIGAEIAALEAAEQARRRPDEPEIAADSGNSRILEIQSDRLLDAQEGHSTLDVQLRGFLARCNFTVQSLLQKYREANCEARSEKPPAHFAATFTFAEFEPAKLSENQRNRAESARKEVGEIIGNAIDEINGEYNRAVGNFRSAKQIEESAAAEVRN